MYCGFICDHVSPDCIVLANVAIDLAGDPLLLRQETGEC
jgi:hypothetical protein